LDIQFIEVFMEISRDFLEESVARWSSVDEPLFLRFQDNIVITSREDAWYLLAPAITPSMLKKFEDLATLVLEEDNPAFELETDKQWMADIFGKTHSLSVELRNGILESLAIMGAFSKSIKSKHNIIFQETVRRVLEQVLPINATWKRWATFNAQLTLFAEADPDFLLSRFEVDLNSGSPQVPILFKDSTVYPFCSSYHSGVLWALEVMAWNKEHLSRVMIILARLYKSECSNPEMKESEVLRTLTNIFIHGMPQTNASIEVKIELQQKLIEVFPDLGWQLLIKQLPESHIQHFDYTTRPRWRDWALGWSHEKCNLESLEYSKQIADLVITTAGNKPEKWANILNGIFLYNEDITQKALHRLTNLIETNNSRSDKFILWKAICKLVNLHESHDNADWRFPTKLINDLSNIRDQLQPDDLIELKSSLFEFDPYLPGIKRWDNPERYREELKLKQTRAIKEIISQLGWNGIKSLISKVPDVNSIGWIIGENELFEFDKMDLWKLISSKDYKFVQFSSFYIAGIFSIRKYAFLETLNLNSQPLENATIVLCSLPFSRPVWDWIDANIDDTINNSFWKTCNSRTHYKDINNLNYVIDKLLKAKRPFSAVEILAWSLTETPAECDLIIHVLEAGLSNEIKHDEIDEHISHPIQLLIKHLQENSYENIARL
ncbi:MAG: hypothetical protein RLP12_08205, partial [Ekhidna sp.]